MTNELVLYEKDGRLATITLNRPDKLNALTVGMIGQFGQILNAIRGDDEISVVIVTGAGKAFSAGADLEFVHSLGSPDEFKKRLKENWHTHFDAMENMEKLFIAAINGIAIGGGVELALACDIRIAAECANFSMLEIRYGLIPDAGGTNRLPKLIGPARTKELIFSGEAISSGEALRIGLLNRVFPDDGFARAAKTYAEKFLDKSPTALGKGKLVVNRGVSLDTRAGLDDAAMLQSLLLGSEEYQEAMRVFHERRKSR